MEVATVQVWRQWRSSNKTLTLSL